MTLVEFLTARLDEDERIANDILTRTGGAGFIVTMFGKGSEVPDKFAQRVLREVEAKRRVLEECTYWEERVEAGAVYTDRPVNPVQQREDEAIGLAHRFEATQAVLRAMGTAYNDHPDYRAEWRP